MRSADAVFLIAALAAILLGGYYGGYAVGLGLAGILTAASAAVVLFELPRTPPDKPHASRKPGRPLAAVARASPPRRAPFARPGDAGLEEIRAPRAVAVGRDEPSSARFPYERKLPLAGPILRSLDAGKRTRGKCGRCGALLTLSAARPVKARCPVCGHVKVLT